MLTSLSRRSKTIAWFFTTVFYLQLIAIPLTTRAAGSAAGYSYRPAKALPTFPWATKAPTLSAPAAVALPTEAGAPANLKKPFTTGPTQPEMQSFQSVNANNMVDLFTGDFSYNIPLLDVGGYPVNLHYSSGITMDQEASWVGLGWNINPGTITRNMRGLPDDFRGDQDQVIKTMNMRPNKTTGVTIGGNMELLGKSQLGKVPSGGGIIDSVKGRPGTLGIALGMFYNTYKGWGTETGINASINTGAAAKGPLTGNLSMTNNSQSGLDISPTMGFRIGKSDAVTKGNITIGTNYNSRIGIQTLQITGEIRQHYASYNSQNRNVGLQVPSYISFAKPSYTPTISVPYTSGGMSFTAKVGSEHWAFHPNGYVRGYTSEQYIDEKDRILSLPAYGYLYYDQAANSKKPALLDFNREKDISFSEETPHIAMPVYTYDTYSISGEGTGGMFRPYRNDIGYVYDHPMTTKSNNDRISLDVGLGQIVHAGLDYDNSYSTTSNGPWQANNLLKDVTAFRKGDTAGYENVYFKNPGEKTAVVNQSFLTMIGDDKLVRADLSPIDQQQEPAFFASRNLSVFKNGKAIDRTTLNGSVRTERDKRTQVISYLTAKQAIKVGLDTMIRSYGINSFPTGTCSGFSAIPRDAGARKEHHLSEIDVLSPDGRRYVYGLPVYNYKTVEASFSTKTGDSVNGTIKYDAKDNTTENQQEKERYFSEEVVSSYAHSFLLTGILSTDYSDLTGDGISEDDQGEAVKFNYSQVYSTGAPYRWRAPYQKDTAAYNDGLKTDNRDQRGSYTYGEREAWYLNSIESKTMIATFRLETDTVRKDGFGVTGINGGRDETQKLYRLKEINLYTKADFLRYGTQAKAIKTVHFAYSYRLCPNNPGSKDNAGKLTLERVWFTYNNNLKGAQNPYVFTYHSQNPAYRSGASDRWGQYKDPARNPGAGRPLTNADYAYTLQADGNRWNSDSAAKYAAPWTLSEISLPSRGKIKVSYESDDYAYVQDKRAMQLVRVAGFAQSPTDAITNNLYTPPTPLTDVVQHFCVFVEVPEAVSNTADVLRKYLEGVNQLYFKLAVNVPGDRWGSGYEFVPCYADIESYGVRSGDNKMIWIRVKAVNKGESPFVTAALQFLRLNLPSKAYPFSEPGDNLDIRAALGMIGSVGASFVDATSGFETRALGKQWCRTVRTDRSFVRLDNPGYRKFGGGLRVKRVEISDSWDTLTNGKLHAATYGQDYSYTTTQTINGAPVTISSGVATYEPSVGGDENPFRVPTKVYKQKAGFLAPADYLYTEEPFGETFFPAPMVGYSRVQVQTINNARKSANGFAVTEFYTSRDFPTQVEYTPLDEESKKTYNPPIANAFKFNAHHNVTLSQGFRVELNDMNGKVKSQASFAQNDTKTPISYTYNYYRVDNENALRRKLSNKVAVADSANGALRYEADMGKEVEMMVDLREQVSVTQAMNLEINFDLAHLVPPFAWFPIVPLPNRETNQYRSVAITKVVNRYGILDSVIHIEKGSKITTRDLVYDAETGAALLTQTNNEFDDPVYNFNYPAHWAYSGMGPAYKNQGLMLIDKNVRQGILYNKSNETLYDASRHFESGDEILVKGRNIRNSEETDTCSPLYYQYEPITRYSKMWAIDASKGYQQQKGIYFIDTNGLPYSGQIDTMWIIRSGKRNMAGIAIGAVSTLALPVKKVNGKDRLFVDSTMRVLNASAARFKDKWRIDNVKRQYDSCVIDTARFFKSLDIPLTIALLRETRSVSTYSYATDYTYDKAVASSKNVNAATGYTSRVIIKPDLSVLEEGTIITGATMNFNGKPPTNLWPASPFNNSGLNYNYHGDFSFAVQLGHYSVPWSGTGAIPWATETSLMLYNNGRPELPFESGNLCRNWRYVDVTELTQTLHSMGPELGNMYLKIKSEAIPNPIVSTARFMSFQAYSNQPDEDTTCVNPYGISLLVDRIRLQANCVKVCRSETLRKDTINPYLYGTLGNWRLDTAFTYYSQRKQAAPDSINLRTDGVINQFKPYWAMGGAALEARPDAFRWVWNSKSTLYNSKGAEIENKDALQRYNAGLYGYNKTLAIAVAQNSRYREIMYDGFEDRLYATNGCSNCAENGWMKTTAGTLNQQVVHTGRYSFRLNGNSSAVTTTGIATSAEAADTMRLSVKKDSQAIVISTVHPQGNGLLTQYGVYWATPPFLNSCVGHSISLGTYEWSSSTSVTYPSAYYSPSQGPSQLPSCVKDYFAVKWTGKLQPQYTGTYRFFADVDDYITFKLNGVTMFDKQAEGYGSVSSAGSPVTLIAGQLYDIEILFRDKTEQAECYFRWSKDGGSPEYIPLQCLYENASQATGTITNDTTWCVKFRAPKPEKALNDTFSPFQAKKMVFSAWVKEEVPCVTGSSYNSGRVRITFDAGGDPVILKPSGPIIEGWQRIEEVVTLPAGANTMSVYLETATATGAYFDDLRMQPFNANMKSFVYDPGNLRLMAELDENNHATFYEYDDEGTLIRLKKETERGIKTIKETRSALSKNPNNP